MGKSFGRSQRWLIAFLLLASSLLQLQLAAPFREQPPGSFPTTADPTWRNLSVQSASALRNLHEKGALLTGFPLYLGPAVIQGTATDAYTSYSPLFLLPPFLYQKLKGAPVTYEELMRMSGVLHGLTAFLAGLLVFLLLIREWPERRALALLSSLLASSAMIWQAPALCWYGNAWWADLVSLPVHLLFFLLLLFVPPSGRRRWLIAGFVFLFGLIDWWFPLTVGFTALLYPFALRRLDALKLLLGPLAASFLLYLVYVIFHGDYNRLLFAFTRRFTGAGTEGHPLWPWSQLWGDLSQSTGALTLGGGLALLLLSLLLLLRRHSTARLPIRLLGILSLSALAHFLALRQHYQDHPWEMVKLALTSSLALGLLPGVLFPWRSWKRKAAMLAAAALTLVFSLEGRKVAAGIQELYVHIDPEILELCRFVDRETGPEDLIFSSFLSIDADLKVQGLSKVESGLLEHVCFNWVNYVGSPGDFPLVKSIMLQRASKSRFRGEAKEVGIYFLLQADHDHAWKEVTEGGEARAFGRFLLYKLGRARLPRASLYQ